jgi:hypothetical protein
MASAGYRQHVMKGDDQERIMAVLKYPEFCLYVYPFFHSLMLTGARWSNVAAAHWDENDLAIARE